MKDIVSFWHEEMSNVPNKCEPEWMDAEDPLFILYTRYTMILSVIIFKIDEIYKHNTVLPKILLLEYSRYSVL